MKQNEKGSFDLNSQNPYKVTLIHEQDSELCIYEEKIHRLADKMILVKLI